MSDDTAVLTRAPAVRFLRNPAVGTVYSPLIDIRSTQHGLHLLSFVPPAAAPADVVVRNGVPVVEVRSSGEVLVPLESVERLIRDLCTVYKNTLLTRLKRDAAASGLTIPADHEITFNGLEDIFAVGQQRPGTSK